MDAARKERYNKTDMDCFEADVKRGTIKKYGGGR